MPLFRRAFASRSLFWLMPVVALGATFGCGDDDEGEGNAKGGASSTGGKTSASGGSTSNSGGSGHGGASGGNAGAASGGAPEAGSGGAPITPQGGVGGDAPIGGNGNGGEGGNVEAGGSGGGGEGGGGPVATCVPETVLKPKLVPLSATGHDGLFGVTFDAQGNIYATGYVGDGTTNADNRKTAVVKFDKAGAPVASFGSAGVAKVDVVTAGSGEMPRGIVLQSDGKIVVSGTVEHDATATGVKANDRDVYAVRFNADGTTDATFGDNGIRILNLNDGVEGTNNQGAATLLAPDAQWGLNVDSTDRLLIHSAQRATGFQSDGTTPRTDTDWAIVRLTKDGALDATFATAGKFTYDIGQASGSARTLTLLPDQSMIATGYATYSGQQRPVLFKLTPDGQGPLWVFSEPVGSAAEAYGAGLQKNGKLVTVGYGRPNASATSSDFVSIRLGASGTLDPDFGQKGATWLDVGGYGDNGRSLTVLGDDRIVLVGGGRLKETDVDGTVAVLTPQGLPDSTFAPGGCKTYDLGSPGDFFWGAALSPDKSFVAVVGITGVPTSSNLNNDSALLILPVN